MAFQFKRDRSDNITLLLAGDIDLEVTPEIKTQLTSQTEDAASLSIDAANISYLDSSGVSILVISMQTCKQKQIRFTISKISEEAMRVLQLAKLDKILPVDEMTGPAELVDVDVFSKTGDADTAIASQVADGPGSENMADTASDTGSDKTSDMDSESATDMASAPTGDDDLIAALASGDMGEPVTESAPAELIEEDTPETVEAMPATQPDPQVETPAEPKPEAAPREKPAQPAASPSDTGEQSGGGGGGFKPGTFG